MKVLEPNPFFIKSRGDTPIGLMEIVRRGAQGVYGVSRSPPHFCNEATFGEKIARKCPFSLHFEARFSKEYSFAKPLKKRCRRSIGDFSFWCRLPDSERRPTDYKSTKTIGRGVPRRSIPFQIGAFFLRPHRAVFGRKAIPSGFPRKAGFPHFGNK